MDFLLYHWQIANWEWPCSVKYVCFFNCEIWPYLVVSLIVCMYKQRLPGTLIFLLLDLLVSMVLCYMYADSLKGQCSCSVNIMFFACMKLEHMNGQYS